MTLDWTTPSDEPMPKHFEDLMAASTCHLSQELFYIHPFALQIRLNQDRTQPTIRDILRMDRKEKALWIESMNKELSSLWDRDCFELRDRHQAEGRQIIPVTWAFKYKVRPDGSLLKRKSRLCLRGDKMIEGLEEGQSADDTDGYAPVIDWGIIRMLLTLSVNFNLKTTSIDFRNAFITAPLKRPMYMEIPPFLENAPHLQGKVLLLKRSLYGHRFAAKLFYELLRDTLTKPKSQKNGMGFKLSPNDHCLFLRDDAIIISWVDDAVILHKDPAVADSIIKALEVNGFVLDKEEADGGLANYLGVSIEKGPKGSLVLKQVGLIDRIIEATGMQEAVTKPTPAAEVLTKSLDSKPFDHSFNYYSVNGMLWHLTNTTRLETQFAVHQCARFSSNPREPHGKAVRRIVQYLIGTRNQGMHLKPDTKVESNRVDCHVDADFAGLYSREDPNDPTSCRSRTGYVITVGNNPVYWKSLMQVETASSTMEAEYIAASTAMKALVYLRRTHHEICKAIDLPYNEESNVSTIFEDNRAALLLATTDPPRLTPRSKSIAVKYHWFREHLKKGSIVMKSVDSARNRANILTKPLKPEAFRTERFFTMGF